MDILGNQQSFGHFGAILAHPEFAAARETGDVLSPVKEETYKLLDDLYAEEVPLLPFPLFNVCCDETVGLGSGPSKELAAKIGVGGVYVRHIRRIHDLLKNKYRKRMMMWGDIILQHPDKLDQIPKDTIMLTWGYDPRASFERPDRALRPFGLRVLRLPRRGRLEPHPAQLRRGRRQHPQLRPRRRQARCPGHAQHRVEGRRRIAPRLQLARLRLGSRVCLERLADDARRSSIAGWAACCSARKATISAKPSSCWPGLTDCPA